MKKYIFFISSFLLLITALILFVSSVKDDSKTDEKYKNYIYKNHHVFSIPLPENIDFAGEKAPIDKFDVRECLDKEVLVNSYWHSSTLILIKRAYRFFPTIEPILKKNNIPDDFKYLAVIESSLSNVVSPAGASGFWQFLNKTGQQYGLKVNEEVDERYNLEKATGAACKYLNESYLKFKNWTLVAASYNMGISGLSQQVKKQGENSYYDLYLNQETARYVYRILAAKLIIGFPRKYGFCFRMKDLYQPIPTDKFESDTTIIDLVEFAKDHHSNYKYLKMFNPWLRKDKLTNKERKKYIIEFPKPEYLSYSKLVEGLRDDENLLFGTPDTLRN